MYVRVSFLVGSRQFPRSCLFIYHFFLFFTYDNDKCNQQDAHYLFSFLLFEGEGGFSISFLVTFLNYDCEIFSHIISFYGVAAWCWRSTFRLYE